MAALKFRRDDGLRVVDLLEAQVEGWKGGGQAALVFGAIVGCDCCLWPHTRKEDERGISSVYPDGSKFSVGVVSW